MNKNETDTDKKVKSTENSSSSIGKSVKTRNLCSYVEEKEEQ